MSENHIITIGEKQYKLTTGLTTKQMRTNWKEFTEAFQSLVGAKDNPMHAFEALGDYQTSMANIIFAAISNEYPHVTQDEVDELTKGELEAAFKVLMEVQSNPKEPAPIKRVKR